MARGGWTGGKLQIWARLGSGPLVFPKKEKKQKKGPPAQQGLFFVFFLESLMGPGWDQLAHKFPRC